MTPLWIASIFSFEFTLRFLSFVGTSILKKNLRLLSKVFVLLNIVCLCLIFLIDICDRLDDG